MTLKEEQLEGGIIRVILEGTLDIEGTAALEPQLTHLTASDKTYVILDLAGVEFMSSIGIGAIVRVAKARRKHGHPRPEAGRSHDSRQNQDRFADTNCL